MSANGSTSLFPRMMKSGEPFSHFPPIFTANGSNSILPRMMNSGEFSDLKFVCNGHTFKVHKAVVCMQSPVIRAAATLPLLESQTNVISMDNFHPNAVKRMVQFMYTGDYDDPKDDPGAQAVSAEENVFSGIAEGEKQAVLSESIAAAPLLEHVRVNSIGDFYKIDPLVSQANRKIEHLLMNHSKDQDMIASLPATTGVALESTGDEKVLDILASAIAKNITTLVESDPFKSMDVMTEFSVKVFQQCAREIKALSQRCGQNAQIETSTQPCKAKENTPSFGGFFPQAPPLFPTTPRN